MKTFLLISLLLISLLFITACSGGNTSDCCDDDGIGNLNQCPVTGTWNVELALANPTAIVTSASQNYSIAGSFSVNIVAYLLTQSAEAPTAESAGWQSIALPAKTITLDSVNHTLTDTTNGNQTTYLWLRDECGSVSSVSGSVSFVLDTEGPTGTLLLDNGAKFTLESDLEVSIDLNVTDVVGIEAYLISADPTQPDNDDPDWILVNTTTLSVNSSITLNSANQAGQVYAWVKDVGGRVTELLDEIEVMRFQSFGLGNDLGQYSSITVDSLDNPYMSFYDAIGKKLGYANLHPDGTITADPIDEALGGDLGKGTSIAADTNGKLHIAYRDTGNAKLKYATNASGAWVTTTIEDGGETPSIALDSDNKVHIVYYFNNDKRYITNRTGAWISQAVLTNGTFVAEPAPSTIRINSDGVIGITGISGQLPRGLRFADNESGNFIEETLSTTFVVGGNSFVYSDDVPVLAYSDASNIFITSKIDGDWTTPEPVAGRGGPLSVDVDSNGFLHIAYYDFDSFVLKYATNFTGTWTTMTVDSTGDVGNYCDIAIDSNDRLHISYYDATNTDLKYATTADVP